MNTVATRSVSFSKEQGHVHVGNPEQFSHTANPPTHRIRARAIKGFQA